MYIRCLITGRFFLKLEDRGLKILNLQKARKYKTLNRTVKYRSQSFTFYFIFDLAANAANPARARPPNIEAAPAATPIPISPFRVSLLCA